MFNSIALDVVIGMVMIYLLYSLLTSILAEMISSWLGIRSRVLRRAIERMLNDGYQVDYAAGYRNRLWRSAGEFFLRENIAFNDSFAGKFYDYPAVKYMSEKPRKWFSPSKASYLTKETFAQTVIHLLRGKGSGNSDMEKIAFCLKFNSLHIQPQTLSYLRNLLTDAGGDVSVFTLSLQNWFEETMQRTTGWYKRKNRLILFAVGFLIAVSFNVDSIKIVCLLSKDNDARGQLVNMGIATAKDTTQFKNFVDQNGDTVHSRAVLDSGFVRVTKDITEANHILGLGWNVPNTKQACKKIEKSDSVMTQETLQRLLFWQRWDSTLKNIADKQRFPDSITFYRFHHDSLRIELAIQGFNSKEKHDSINKGIKDDSSRIFKATYQDTILSRALHDCKDSISKRELELAKIIDRDFVRIDSIVPQNNPILLYGEIPRNAFAQFWYKIGFVLSESFPSKSGFWGFLITALMLSLGAPFWFDLLQKLVALRGAGVKPEEKKNENTDDGKQSIRPTLAPENPPAASVIKQVAPLDAVVQNVKEKISTYSNVISIEPGYVKVKGIKLEAVEIHVLDNGTISKLKKALNSVEIGYPVRYLVNTRPILHMLANGCTVFNQQRSSSIGTLGCFLNREGSAKKYLLSCWHVLNYGNENVLDSNSNVVAKVVDGCLSPLIDIGFAELLSDNGENNQSINVLHPWRPIIPDDAFMETQVHFTGINSINQSAVIYKRTTPPKGWTYPDGAYHEFIDLFTITLYDGDGNPTSPSSPGDSGSVIVDGNGYPLGVIVGGDTCFSYAAKFSNILAKGCIYDSYSIIV
jgi:hypothetical protein